MAKKSFTKVEDEFVEEKEVRGRKYLLCKKEDGSEVYYPATVSKKTNKGVVSVESDYLKYMRKDGK